MANIHYIGGEKGGVGKSLVSRLLAQYMIDRNIAFIGFDTDKSHGALLRFYSGFASPVVIDSYNSLDAIVEAAAANHQRRVLVDLAAQTHAPLVKWMEDSGVLEMGGELGIDIQYWHVMDSGKDSTDLLKKLFDQFGPRLRYNLVLNQLRGEQFEIFENSPEWSRAKEFNARIVTIGRLLDGTVNKIDARSSSFWAAINVNDAQTTGMGLLERQRVKVWLNRAYEQFDTLDI